MSTQLHRIGETVPQNREIVPRLRPIHEYPYRAILLAEDEVFSAVMVDINGKHTACLARYGDAASVRPNWLELPVPRTEQQQTDAAIHLPCFPLWTEKILSQHDINRPIAVEVRDVCIATGCDLCEPGKRLQSKTKTTVVP